MAYKKRSERKHRSFGGRAEKNEHQYDAQGSPEEKEEHAKSEGFKRGGSHHHRKHGGHVDGEHAKHHMGHRARGGRMEEEHEKHAKGGKVGRMSHHAAARGGSPFSSGRTKTGPGNQKGSPGEQAPLEP